MDFAKMQEAMAQAKKMQEQMDRTMSETLVEADSGGGMVTVRMNGKKLVQRITIDPAAINGTGPAEIEMLEDLIAAAVNAAGRKADDAMSSSVQGLLGGLKIPGL
jgi:DNA-binding YbaB/EbfC family protein